MCVLRLACRCIADVTNATLQRCLKRFVSRNNSIQKFTRLRHPRKRVFLWLLTSDLWLKVSYDFIYLWLFLP
jgi:hypothetical protein